MKSVKKLLACIVLVGCLMVNAACSARAAEKVVIYTNADEEAIVAMENALNKNGFKDQYILQGMGTSELGGKLLAEGKSIDANLITISSYFVESAQKTHNMFVPLTTDAQTLFPHPDYYRPILANTGAIFVNTEVITAEGLDMPKSIMDLTNPMYKDLVSVPSIMDSSTAWLMMQGIVDAYDSDALSVTKALVENCGAHVESSGSGPIKKVRVGEVAVGFGLRHQAVADQVEGKPIQFIDPVEGNFSLTESIAVVDSEDAIEALAQEMAAVIIKEAREELIGYYPVALYEGESVDSLYKPANAKVFEEPLTVDLLTEHQNLFKEASNQ